MIFGRWEVFIPDRRIGGSSVKVAQLHSRKRAEERAKYLGGRVVDRKMLRSW